MDNRLAGGYFVFQSPQLLKQGGTTLLSTTTWPVPWLEVQVKGHTIIPMSRTIVFKGINHCCWAVHRDAGTVYLPLDSGIISISIHGSAKELLWFPLISQAVALCVTTAAKLVRYTRWEFMSLQTDDNKSLDWKQHNTILTALSTLPLGGLQVLPL